MKSIIAIAACLASLSMGKAGEQSVRYEVKTTTQCVTDANGKTTCVPVTTVVPVVFMSADSLAPLEATAADCATCAASASSSVTTVRTREAIFARGRLFSRLFGRLRGLSGGCS